MVLCTSLGQGTISLVRLCWSFVYCCRYHLVCFFSHLYIHAMGKKSLTEAQSSQIVTLHGERYTERDIAAKLHCSKTAMHNARISTGTQVLGDELSLARLESISRTQVTIQWRSLCNFTTNLMGGGTWAGEGKKLNVGRLHPVRYFITMIY